VNHPALIANRAATIDRISNGRFVLGMGAGWQVNEHAAFGIDLLANGPRVDRFEEAIEIVSRMLSEDRVTFSGKHFTITNAPCEPKPVQSQLPILVGTGGPRMLRKKIAIRTQCASQFRRLSSLRPMNHRLIRCGPKFRPTAQLWAHRNS
jgi:alkanesulfonate monooxygenase SsuD/methylene tetrahydromethanopterin reductase-like flavin-dependent oxidoreductase (luciferase family)